MVCVSVCRRAVCRVCVCVCVCVCRPAVCVCVCVSESHVLGGCVCVCVRELCVGRVCVLLVASDTTEKYAVCVHMRSPQLVMELLYGLNLDSGETTYYTGTTCNTTIKTYTNNSKLTLAIINCIVNNMQTSIFVYLSQVISSSQY